MTAKVVDVTPPGGTAPIGLGGPPGFGISLSGFTALDTFVTNNPTSLNPFAPFSTGFGDVLHEAFMATNWADTGLTTHTDFDGSSRTSRFGTVTVPPTTSSPGAFMGKLNGSFASLGGVGSDGITKCVEASPTAANSYAALYMGNRCLTKVGSITIGPPVAPSSWQGFDDRTLNGTGKTMFYNNAPGCLSIVVVVEPTVSASHALPKAGWTLYKQDPDGIGAAVSVWTRVMQAGDSNNGFFGFSASSVGRIISGYLLTGVDATTPVEVSATAVTDGTAADAPSVTTGALGLSLVMTFLAKTATAYTPPAGWTIRAGGNVGGGAGGTRMVIADRTFTPPATTTGTISFTGAITSSFGTAITLSIKRAVRQGEIASVPGNVTITEVGFTPDLILFSCGDPRGLNGGDGNAWLLGAADRDGNQWAAATRSAFLSGSSGSGGLLNRVTRYRHFYDNACVAHIGAVGFAEPTTHDVVGSLVSMTATGFTLNMSTMTAATNVTITYLAVRAFSGGRHKVGSGSSRTSAGTQVIGGVGFQPDAVLAASVQTTDTLVNNNAGTAAAGFSDGVLDRGFWAGCESGVVGGRPPCCPQGVQASKLLTFGHHDGIVLSQASVTSLDADGFTLDWLTADGNAYRYGWVALTDHLDPIPCAHINPTFHGDFRISDVDDSATGGGSFAPTLRGQFRISDQDVLSPPDSPSDGPTFKGAFRTS